MSSAAKSQNSSNVLSVDMAIEANGGARVAIRIAGVGESFGRKSDVCDGIGGTDSGDGLRSVVSYLNPVLDMYRL